MNKYSILYPFESETRLVIDLSGTWKFKLDSKNEGRINDWKNGLQNFTTIPVPSSFADLFTQKNIREFCGDIWYEKDFFISEEWKEKEINIRFFSAAHKATVWVNGIEVGSHIGGYTPFVVNLNDCAKFGEKNKVVVVVNNELSLSTIPVGNTKVLSSGRKINIPSFDFFNYSGLERPVKMLVLPKESVTNVDVITDIDKTIGIVNYEVKTNGWNIVEVHVCDQKENIVSEKQYGLKGQFKIDNVHFWEPGKGYLYTLCVSIIDSNKELIDKYCLPFGIRTVKVENNNFLINGKPFYFKGFGKHEESEINGRGYNPVIIKRDFELIKWVGANSFRTSHYPYSEEILQEADKEGIVVIDEVAAVGMFDVSSVFDPGSTNKKDYFSNDVVHTETKQAHINAVSELIERDKNHPCVVMWSLFNEPDTTKEYCVPYFEAIFEHARKIDKQKLPKTFVSIQLSGPDVCKCNQLVDVICLNRYYGWYFQFGTQIEEGILEMTKELQKWETKGKPIVFTEFGCDTVSGIHKLPSVMWSEEYYVEYMSAYFKVFDSFKSVKGEQLWNFADFQTVEGIMRVDGNKKGIFTRNRQPKMIAHFIKNRWTKLSNNHKS